MKTMLVTGATSGIGKAFTLHAAVRDILLLLVAEMRKRWRSWHLNPISPPQNLI